MSVPLMPLPRSYMSAAYVPGATFPMQAASERETLPIHMHCTGRSRLVHLSSLWLIPVPSFLNKADRSLRSFLPLDGH